MRDARAPVWRSGGPACGACSGLRMISRLPAGPYAEQVGPERSTPDGGASGGKGIADERGDAESESEPPREEATKTERAHPATHGPSIAGAYDGQETSSGNIMRRYRSHKAHATEVDNAGIMFKHLERPT